MTHRIFGILSFVLGLFLSGSPIGFGNAAADVGAQRFMEGKNQELKAAFREDKGPAREQKLVRIFDSMLDYDALAQSSLKDFWSGLSAEQRREFQEVLTKLVQRAYRRNLDKTESYEVEFSGEQQVELGTLVKSVASDRKKARAEPLRIDYLLHKLEGKWLVRDVITEGSSLVKNYQRQFAKIIRKQPDQQAGFQDLLQRMKKKLESGEDARQPE